MGLSGCFLSPVPAIVEEISMRFQTTPSWDAIRSHLFLNEFKPGMTRDEIHRILDKIGPWAIYFVDDHPVWNPGRKLWLYQEQIYFTEKKTFQGIGYWDFVYDKNDILVSQERIDVP
jgi:hypothetical protein